MKALLTASQVEALRRKAKQLVREEGLGYSQALDRLAQSKDYTNWSLLQKNGVLDGPQPYQFRRSDDEMAAALRVVPEPTRWDRRTRSEIVRSETADLSGKFISPANAVDYAVAYVEALLRRPRFRIDHKAVASWEMRSWLPYGAVPMGEPGYILVNRNYKPVGSPVTDFARYEDFGHLHLQLDDEEWRSFATPSSSQPFLYNDGCLPWRSRQDVEAYLRRLHELRKVLS